MQAMMIPGKALVLLYSLKAEGLTGRTLRERFLLLWFGRRA